MLSPARIKTGAKAFAIHLICSLFVAVIAAAFVFFFWYPFPFRDLSGGRELFFLVVSVDVICGPLLTFVIFNPAKPRAELRRDLFLIALIQLSALLYGIHTVWQARPLFLVLELDRFKVITAPALEKSAVDLLPAALQPQFFGGPKTVALRNPKDRAEQQSVLLDSVQGGRDYAERADFYIPYEGSSAQKALLRAKSLDIFLKRYPLETAAAQKIAISKSADINQWLYLPVTGRQDWIAIVDKQGQIQGFLPGDGF